MIYGPFQRSKEDIAAIVNRVQRKYDFDIKEEDNGAYRVTLSDGVRSSDVLITPNEDIESEVMRLVADVDSHKYDTED